MDLLREANGIYSTIRPVWGFAGWDLHFSDVCARVPIGDRGRAGTRALRHNMRSEHFIMHTDLSPIEAQHVLDRMEATLQTVAGYWKREPRGLIECYVVHDLSNWPDSALPHPMARMVIDQIGGAAISSQVGAGIYSHAKSTIIASSTPGVAEHEVVHAYCGQAFGTTGPTWYGEGMAQMLTYGPDECAEVRCPPTTLARLRSSRPRTISDVIQSGAAARQLFDALESQTSGDGNVLGFNPDGGWTDGNTRSLEHVKDAYAWNWLVCHLLQHNPNYRVRFKSLGQNYLAHRDDSFGALFGPVSDQLLFEYRFLQEHVDNGFRVDLCNWDWQKKFRSLESGRRVAIRVQAARGYQGSGLQVTSGARYHYSAAGTWQTDQGDDAVDADGNDRGTGRLEAVVMTGYELSAPFELGRQGRFRAPCDGRLYLRCRDDWNRLSDNEGSVVVTLSQPRRR